MDRITKNFIGLYKLKKCLIWEFKNINIMATIIIIILLCAVIFQQFYFQREIDQRDTAIKKHLTYLQLAYSNITNQLEDVQTKVEDYSSSDWQKNSSEIKAMLEALDDKVSYFESSIFNYYSPSRMKRQKVLF